MIKPRMICISHIKLTACTHCHHNAIDTADWLAMTSSARKSLIHYHQTPSQANIPCYAMAGFTIKNNMVSGILLNQINETMDQFKCLCHAEIHLWTTQLTIVYFGIFTYLASTVKILCDFRKCKPISSCISIFSNISVFI